MDVAYKEPSDLRRGVSPNISTNHTSSNASFILPHYNVPEHSYNRIISELIERKLSRTISE